VQGVRNNLKEQDSGNCWLIDVHEEMTPPTTTPSMMDEYQKKGLTKFAFRK
jgi:hypothetical protein